MKHNKLLGYVVLALGLVCPGMAVGQNYPTKPVRLIVNYPPGSGSDIVMRLIAAKLGSPLGQQVVVENRGGASGHIGTEIVAHAVPDGYTLGSTTAAIISSWSLYPKLGYNIERDIDPVVLVASVPFILVVHPSLPVKTVMELVALARAKPGEFNYASTGNGSTPHLAMESIKMQEKIRMTHVPYKGSSPALTDLLANQVQMMFANTLSALPIVKAGRLRALAISGSKRSAAAPELPTVAEAGMPGFEASTWFGILAPAGTPKDIIVRFNGEVRKILQMPDVLERLKAQGAEPIGSTPEEFRNYIKSELIKWEKVVKAAGIRLE